MCECIIKINIFIFIIMDNQNIGSILQSNNGASFVSSSNGFSSDTSNPSGFLSGLANVSLTTWVIFFLILAFLGFNIFVYLAKGTQDITNFFAPLLERIFGVTTSVVGDAIDVSAEGAKTVIGGTANALDAGLTAVQDITPNNASTSVKSQPVKNTIQQPDIMANNTLNKALNTNQNQKQKQQGPSQNNDYQANEASSSIGTSGKAGWCYIGQDRGYRSCAEVGVNDECMSGDIFPTQEICVNPNLRA